MATDSSSVEQGFIPLNQEQDAAQPNGVSLKTFLKKRNVIMLASAVGLLVLFSIVIGTGGGAPSAGCTPGDIRSDYFKLVLQWPPAFGTDLGNKVNYWTIHGLWPSRIKNSQTYPCTCTEEAFNPAEVKDLLPSMRRYWPSFKNSDYESFWSHEWEKHGTCCGPSIKSQHQYFDSTINMRSLVDPGAMLSDLKPSATQGYSFSDIYDRLSVHGDVGLHCRQRSSGQVLTEVDFCMTAAAIPAQFSCPKVSLDTSTACDPYSPIIILPASSSP